MLYYDRIDVFEGIDADKTSESKDCDICHYWYFLSKEFKFQPYVCNICHYLLMMSMNLIIISGISKSEAINLMQNTDLTEKTEHYKT